MTTHPLAPRTWCVAGSCRFDVAAALLWGQQGLLGESGSKTVKPLFLDGPARGEEPPPMQAFQESRLPHPDGLGARTTAVGRAGSGNGRLNGSTEK